MDGDHRRNDLTTETQDTEKSNFTDFLSMSLGVLNSFPKDRRSHPHAGRTLLNRNFKVMRHPHGKYIYADREQSLRRDLIANLPQLTKKRTGRLGGFCKWRNCH